MSQKNPELQALLAKGLKRRTAYNRLKGRIKHCKTCSCFKSPKLTKEQLSNLEELKPSSKFTLCSKHGGWKNSCGCD